MLLTLSFASFLPYISALFIHLCRWISMLQRCSKVKSFYLWMCDENEQYGMEKKLINYVCTFLPSFFPRLYATFSCVWYYQAMCEWRVVFISQIALQCILKVCEYNKRKNRKNWGKFPILSADEFCMFWNSPVFFCVSV